MKKSSLIVLGAVSLIAAGNANAAVGSVCSGAAVAANGTSVASSDTGFVKVGFTPKCSANVHVYYDLTGTAAGVGSASTKGKTSFRGNTNGGAVQKYTDCASTGCTATNASDAATQAMADASS